MTDNERFEALCRKDMESLHFSEGIGTYKEKRLHRILKSYITENESAYEIPIGKYVADIFENGSITEIQTTTFQRLLPKLRFYLGETDHKITVVCPVIRNKRIIRIDPETGEIMRSKMSPAHGTFSDILPSLYHIREVIPDRRLRIRVLLIDAEEYRYSERQRYRKEGAYDCELFPVSVAEERIFSVPNDFSEFLPLDRESFSAAEYSKIIKLRGRKLYSSLNFLCSVGLLCREKEGKKYIYHKKPI